MIPQTSDDLARLHALCFTTPRPWSAAEFGSLLTDTGVFLVTRPFGFALGRSVLDETELLTLAVAPHRQGQGIGRDVLHAFTRRAEAYIFLEVAAQNTVAIHLYTSAGFTVSGRRKAYYRTPQGMNIDALVMTKMQ